MDSVDIFILFPETDEEILALGDDLGRYHDIVHELQALKKELEGFKYRLYYDSENLKSFISQAKRICDEKYLGDPIQQLRFLLGSRTTNVRKQCNVRPDCTYCKWDLHRLSVEEVAYIIKSSVEQTAVAPGGTEVVVVAFMAEDSLQRDMLPVIKDALHIEGLPKLYNIHYFNPVNTFIQWRRSKLGNRAFSLQDVTRFERTSFVYGSSKQRIYKEISTSRYWYYDYFHKDNREHYEVFNMDGTHYAEADENGSIDRTRQDDSKSIKDIIHGS